MNKMSKRKKRRKLSKLLNICKSLKLRIPTAPPSKIFKTKKSYNRTENKQSVSRELNE